MSQVEERRAHERFRVNEEFATLDGLMTDYVADVSRGGIFLRCEERLPIGTRVQLCFTVLLDDLETIEGLGEVVNHRAGEHPGMGIRFIELSAHSRQLVNRICAERAPG